MAKQRGAYERRGNAKRRDAETRANAHMPQGFADIRGAFKAWKAKHGGDMRVSRSIIVGIAQTPTETGTNGTKTHTGAGVDS